MMSSGQPWRRSFRKQCTSGAGATRWAMCSTRYRNRSMVGPRRTCKRSGWPPHAMKLMRHSRNLSGTTRPSIRRPLKRSKKIGTACWRFTISRLNIGSIFARPTRSNRRSPQCATEPAAPAIAYHDRPSLDWHSN